MNSGERVLITGGSGGIGSAIAIACADRNAWPIVGYHRNATRAAEVVARCRQGEAWQIDLCALPGDVPAVEAVVHCAAAFAPERSLLDVFEEQLEELLAVNLLGPLRLTRAVATSSNTLKRIVFILSSAAFCRGSGPYALSKAAELALCRLLANELAPRGVRVDALVPGWTATPMAEQAAQATGRSLSEIAERHPDGVLLAPQDMGELCATLLFDHSDALPGNLIVWDLRDGPEAVWREFNAINADSELASSGWKA